MRAIICLCVTNGENKFSFCFNFEKLCKCKYFALLTRLPQLPLPLPLLSKMLNNRPRRQKMEKATCKKIVFCFQNCSDLFARKKCSSDREKLLTSKAEGREFAKMFEITRTVCFTASALILKNSVSVNTLLF